MRRPNCSSLSLALHKIHWILFYSDTTPTRAMIAIASILYSMSMFGVLESTTIVPVNTLSALLLISGIVQLWGLIHEEISSRVSALLNIIVSAVWVISAWCEYYEFQATTFITHGELPALATIATMSCWLLVRCGTGTRYRRAID